MRTHTWTGALVLVLVAGLAAGCGDDDGDDDGATPTDPPESTEPDPTESSEPDPDVPEERRVFLAEADALCELAEVEIQTSGENSEPDADFMNDVYIPRIQQLVDDLRAVTPPEGEEAEVQAILDAAQQVVDDFEEDPLRFNDQTWIEENVMPLSEQAEAFGLEACFTD